MFSSSQLFADLSGGELEFRGNGIELVDDVLRVVFIAGIVGAGIGQVAQQDELLCPGLPI